MLTRSAVFLLSLRLLATSATTVDLTSNNRRPPLIGLPDWSKVGFAQGARPLPDDSDVRRIIGPDQLASWGLIPNDGQDDTAALERAIMDVQGNPTAPGYTLIQLPAGVINLRSTVYIHKSYIILRGAGNDPETGTKIVFRPDNNVIYDKLTDDGSQWDLDGMTWSWDLPHEDSVHPRSKGSATSGWLWPGRSIFRIGSKEVAGKYRRAYDDSGVPENRRDIFWGSVNYHWRNDEGKEKGFKASQLNDIAGYKGTNKVYIANATETIWRPGMQVWVGSPVRAHDYDGWGVATESYYVNSYVYQDWFEVTGTGSDDNGPFLELDHPLRFNLYANSTSSGSPAMEETVAFGKVMPIDDPITNIGIENLYMTQEIDGLNPKDAESNFGNLKPEQAMHGIVLRFAKDVWIRNIRTFMTGSHPIATEAARHIQVQDSFFDGAWNKGKGGNGYLRGSRVWDSLYFNLTARNLRHFTFQWCAMGNVAMLLNVTNDLNLHGGWESENLFELNYVAPPYSHRSGSCTSNCGGEGGSSEGGTWWPIYWSTGEKASKWSGATGYQNVFFRNYMIKQPQPNVDFVEYQPYFARDGSLSNKIWQFGWDRSSSFGDHYQHISTDSSCVDGSCLLKDWQGHEQYAFHEDPGLGVNGDREDTHTSLFLRDVTNATDSIVQYSSIAGYAYCRGKVAPKVVGYYLASAASNTCSPFQPIHVDYTAYSHVLVAYANLAADGTVSVPASIQSTLQDVANLKAKESALKVFLAVGGYGLGADSTSIVKIAASSSARTKFGTSAASVLRSYGLDGLDVEWAPGITANQFANIITAIKQGLGSGLNVSVSTPQDFWALSGVNKVTIPLDGAVEFISLITHAYDPANGNSPNMAANLEATLEKVQRAGFPPEKTLMGIPFYARSSALSGKCRAPGLGEGIIPFYGIDSIVEQGNFDNADWLVSASDPKTHTAKLELNDHSVLVYDDAAAVTYKAGLSTNLCMGGVSVFSIDQDHLAYRLTNAIYDAGGITPDAKEIAASITGSVLDNNGLVNQNYMDSITSALSDKYPFLSVVSTYRVLGYSVLSAVSELAGQMRELIWDSSLSQDNFELYKRWQGKTFNWAIANLTGAGNRFWECRVFWDTHVPNEPLMEWSTENCASSFDTPYPRWMNELWWRLKDANGFAEYMANELGIDTSQLIIGDIKVDMSEDFCHNDDGPGPKRIRSTSESEQNHTTHTYLLGEDDGTGRIVATGQIIQVERRDLDKPTPVDVDPKCFYTWKNVLLINETDFFSNPREGILDYLGDQKEFLEQAYEDLESPFTHIGTLSGLLEAGLTNLAIGDSTIDNTRTYISQVKLDKELQATYDAWVDAHTVGTEFLIDLALTVLGFIPIFDIGAAILRGARIFKAVGESIRIGRLTRSAQNVELANALKNGAATTADIRSAASKFEAFLPKRVLEMRGKIGSKIERVNRRIRQCADEGFEYLLDAADLATVLIPEGALSARSVTKIKPLEPTRRSPNFTAPRSTNHRMSKSLWRHHNPLLKKRAFESEYCKTKEGKTITSSGSEVKCIFDTKRSEQFKGYMYDKQCCDNGDIMEFFDASTNAYVKGTFDQCKQKNSADALTGYCNCDHLVEATEILKPMKSGITSSDKAALCKKGVLPDAFHEGFLRIINGQENMRGLSDGANGMKQNLLNVKNYKAGPNGHIDFSKSAYVLDKTADEARILDEYMARNEAQRAKVAKELDDYIKSWADKLPDDDNVKRRWNKFIKSDTMFSDYVKLGSDNLKQKLPLLQKAIEDAPVLDPGETSNDGKRKRPNTLTVPDDGSCKKSRANTPVTVPGTPEPN